MAASARRKIQRATNRLHGPACVSKSQRTGLLASHVARVVCTRLRGRRSMTLDLRNPQHPSRCRLSAARLLYQPEMPGQAHLNFSRAKITTSVLFRWFGRPIHLLLSRNRRRSHSSGQKSVYLRGVLGQLHHPKWPIGNPKSRNQIKMRLPWSDTGLSEAARIGSRTPAQDRSRLIGQLEIASGLGM